MCDRIWISWERHRRSRVLADHFRCSFHEIVETGPLRYLKCLGRTVGLLLRTRPKTLVVQNPSMVLASLAVAWGLVSGTFVVVDRHSTFLLNRKYRISPWLVIFRTLNRFTLRFADITVVTNDFLAELVRRHGGTPYVLPDKLPDLEGCRGDPYELDPGVRNAFLISSFAEDEPIEEVIQGLSLVSDRRVHLYVSGNSTRAPARLLDGLPDNVTLTGYLPDADFFRLLCSVDLVLVLTSADYTMLCGCYEAVSAGQPLVTSDKGVLRDYFRGAFFVDNSPAAFADVLALPEEEIGACRERMESLRGELQRSWIAEAAELDSMMRAED